MTKFINLKTSPNRVEFTGDFLIEDEGLYEFFKQYGAGEYDHWFERALRLGAYALEEERIAAFLGRAENEIDAGLERTVPDVGDLEQIGVSVEVQAGRRPSKIIERLEVAEQRRRRDARPFGDLFGGRWDVAFENEVDHRLGDRQPPALPARSTSVDRGFGTGRHVGLLRVHVECAVGMMMRVALPEIY